MSGCGCVEKAFMGLRRQLTVWRLMARSVKTEPFLHSKIWNREVFVYSRPSAMPGLECSKGTSD